jgi:hypothetical protein
VALSIQGDGEVVAEGSNFFEEESEVIVVDVLVEAEVALAIDDADVHGAGVEVDSAVEGGGGLMVSHRVMVSLRREVVLPARFKVSGGPVGSAPSAPALQSQLTPTSKGLDEFQIAATNADNAL